MRAVFARSGKTALHPRNRHQGHYDFEQLIKSSPDLAPFVSTTPYHKLSIDFSDPEAVKCLNRALLKHFYGISTWEIPPNYLCPPVPGRADYLHSIADLLSTTNGGIIPRGASVRVLDIGVGANCIYPIIGHCEYGWYFIGADIDPIALASAKQIVQANPVLSNGIELRLQKSPLNIFKGLFQNDEVFDLSICNPPFHASLEDARKGSQRKWKNLGLTPRLNFGGHGSELWCPGGEAAFVRRMIEESIEFSSRVLWFSTLVSKESTLPTVYAALKKAKATDSRTIEMAQGQKKSRIVAWTFLPL
ncbi:23S rRNA (adenine(1618)-N(6))-methyltransferase RlmF [Bdellovibrionota bacterium FG-1]